MPAIWTDANGRVTRTHYNSDELPASATDDAFIVDSVPNSDKPAPYYSQELYYDEQNGFHYEYTDPFAQFSVTLSDGVKKELYREIRAGDFEATMDTVEQLLNS
jgi:hypothetical protein